MMDMHGMMGWMMGLGLLGWVLVIGLLAAIVVLLLRLANRPDRDLDHRRQGSDLPPSADR